MQNNQVLVPHSFFKKSKKEYKRWVFAFFRELIQNSNDAKSTEIHFRLNENDKGVVIECNDNGKGMNKDILVNKLLCLGGSHKDEGATGGFGYAKTLLFFAHQSYQVKTNNFLVEGSGGNYSISENEDHVSGTHIKIVMDKDSEDGISVERLKFELEKIVSLSSFNTKIYLDNVLLEKDFNSFDYKIDTPIGKLRFSDNNKRYSTLWVRVNGIPMFSESFYDDNSSCFEGVIELDKRSIDVLTSNRDSLKDQAEADFRSIIKSLQKERSSLKSPSFEEIVLNEKSINNIDCADDNESEIESECVSQFKDSNILETKEEKETGDEPLSGNFNPFSKIKKKIDAKKKSANSILSKINEDNYPLNFNISLNNSGMTYGEIKDELNKQRNHKLAKKWISVCHSVLDAVIHSSNYYWRFENKGGIYFFDKKPISFGFSLSKGLYAANQSSSSGYKILLNPIAFKSILSDYNYGNNRKLLDLAIHEITHLFQDYHDEEFSSIEGKIKWAVYDHLKVTDINLNNL